MAHPIIDYPTKSTRKGLIHNQRIGGKKECERWWSLMQRDGGIGREEDREKNSAHTLARGQNPLKSKHR